MRRPTTTKQQEGKQQGCDVSLRAKQKTHLHGQNPAFGSTSATISLGSPVKRPASSRCLGLQLVVFSPVGARSGTRLHFPYMSIPLVGKNDSKPFCKGCVCVCCVLCYPSTVYITVTGSVPPPKNPPFSVSHQISRSIHTCRSVNWKCEEIKLVLAFFP